MRSVLDLGCGDGQLLEVQKKTVWPWFCVVRADVFFSSKCFIVFLIVFLDRFSFGLWVLVFALFGMIFDWHLKGLYGTFSRWFFMFFSKSLGLW